MADGLDIAEQFLDSLQQEQPCEDERTRKSLLAYIKGESKRLETKKWIAYLEKPMQVIRKCEETEKSALKKCEEVDLEKEIKRYGKEEMPVVLESDLNDIARHFYELGKQSREPVSEDLEERKEGIPGKDFSPVEWVEACKEYGDWKIVKVEQSSEELDAEIEMVWDSFNKHLAEYDGESEDVVWLNRFSFEDIANYFYELGQQAKKGE